MKRFLQIFAIFISILITISLIRILLGGSTISFTGFLDYSSNAPDVYIASNYLDKFTITSNWDIDCGLFTISFNWLKNFFNLFAKLLGYVSYVIELGFQCLSFFIYFIKFIFV